MIQLRKELPRATVAHLIEQMQHRGLLSPPMTLSPSTVYRLLHGQHLMHPAVVRTDRRKFEAECVNDLWQSDVMHGPQVLSDGKRRKAYLIAVIDDHSRLIPQAEFYLNERLSSYVEALQQALFTARAAAQALCRQRLGLPLPAAGAYLRLAGHCPHPLQALHPRGSRQNRALLQDRARRVLGRLQRRQLARPQRGLGAVADRGLSPPDSQCHGSKPLCSLYRQPAVHPMPPRRT